MAFIHQKRSAPTVFQIFIFNLLDYWWLPAVELAALESNAKKALQKRHMLITFYESLPFIQTYTSGGRKRGDHEENTSLAFYLRNTAEQQLILDHFLHGLKERALAKSRNSVFDKLTHLSDAFFDRPYLTAFVNNESYFDHREIDRVDHRLLNDVIGDLELRPLYDTNKESFYQQLVALYPFSKVVHDIQYYLVMLGNLNEQRKVLFEELIELFEGKKFYVFYALALAQVEGLFSEMLSKIDSKAYKSTLQEKVKAVRPSYNRSARNFDYFEYYIGKNGQVD